MNEWNIFSINVCHFWWKNLFLSIWTHFWAIFVNFSFRPVSMIPWLLNWIIFWIESAEFSLNLIMYWIESWLKQFWIEYWMNHFLAKFKYWIESDRVSKTSRWRGPWRLRSCPPSWLAWRSSWRLREGSTLPAPDSSVRTTSSTKWSLRWNVLVQQNRRSWSRRAILPMPSGLRPLGKGRQPA